MLDESQVEQPIYFPEGSVPQLADLCAVCRREGLAEIADIYEEQALPCFALEAPEPEEVGPDGFMSRIGGAPNFPSSEVWPQCNGNSLPFVAQINLAEIPRSAASEVLPPHGILYFFFSEEQWASDPWGKESWRVLFCEDVPADTSRAAFPDDIPRYTRYTEMCVKPVQRDSVPDLFDMNPDAFYSGGRFGSWTEEQTSRFCVICDQYEERLGAFHRLLGHPHQQNFGDMRQQCQLASHGFHGGNPAGCASPEAEALKEGISDWRLLLQVNTDDRTNMQWGDLGMLYFWIREEDLAARRFDKVWMVIQCG